MNLITSHISQVVLNSSSEVRGIFPGLGRSGLETLIDGIDGHPFIEFTELGVIGASETSSWWELNTAGS